MANLKTDREKSNLGGLAEFKFIYERQLTQKIEIINGQALQFISSSEFIVPDIVFESSSLKEIKTDANLFEYEYTAYCARDDLSKLQDAARLDANKIIAIVKDNNGESRLLGQKDNACIVEIGFNKGSKVSELNAYELKINWKSQYRSAFANDIYVVTDAYQFEDGEFYTFND